MLQPRLALTLAALLALAVAVPAAAEHGGDIHPTLRTERTYFHCAGDVKLQNIGVTQSQIPSWDDQEPAGSVQDGEGCGFYDNLLSADGRNAFDPVWRGTFTGNLDSLAVELHRLVPQPGVTAPNLVNVTVLVDGLVRLQVEQVELFFVASDTGLSESTVFAVTDLGYLAEDGDGSIEREIELRLASYNETQSLWVFDTTEVPAGITFNPEQLILPAYPAD